MNSVSGRVGTVIEARDAGQLHQDTGLVFDPLETGCSVPEAHARRSRCTGEGDQVVCVAGEPVCRMPAHRSISCLRGMETARTRKEQQDREMPVMAASRARTTGSSQVFGTNR